MIVGESSSVDSSIYVLKVCQECTRIKFELLAQTFRSVVGIRTAMPAANEWETGL